jgi:hypothetical protein
MAAHVKTALQEMLDRKMPCNQIQHGIGYAMFGDQLNFDHWQLINELCNQNKQDDVLLVIRAIYPIYEKLWRALGYPKCAEDWNNAMYAKDRKSVIRHNWIVKLFI